MISYETQLADPNPQIDTPLRVEAPASVNAPPRVRQASRDSRIQQTSFSPAALQRRQEEEEVAVAGGSGDARKPDVSSGVLSHTAITRTAVRHYAMLAESSHRAGNIAVEASAHFGTAVLLDNQQRYSEAIEFYERYATLADGNQTISQLGEAYNCMGVDYMLLACPATDIGFVEASEDRQGADSDESLDQRQRYLLNAIQCHETHFSVTDDGGQFVAHINLGLCNAALGRHEQSLHHNQEALRIAVRMGTLYGQSIAVGNLGILAKKQKDYVTAQASLEQHLQIAQTLQDIEAEVNAWNMLAQLALDKHDFESALSHLEHVCGLAREHRLMNELRRVLCLMGVVRGKLDMNEFVMHTRAQAGLGVAS